jgi:DNA replication protein DnaC
MLTALAKTDVLMLDDWGLAPLNDANRRDLLEIIEDRHDWSRTRGLRIFFRDLSQATCVV